MWRGPCGRGRCRCGSKHGRKGTFRRNASARRARSRSVRFLFPSRTPLPERPGGRGTAPSRRVSVRAGISNPSLLPNTRGVDPGFQMGTCIFLSFDFPGECELERCSGGGCDGILFCSLTCLLTYVDSYAYLFDRSPRKSMTETPRSNGRGEMIPKTFSFLLTIPKP